MQKVKSPYTGKSKTLFIETCEFASHLNISQDLKESLTLSKGKADTLIVKNLPCTILNRENQNGRIYSTAEVQQAINDAKQLGLFETKQLLSQADEHPEGSYVAPSHASHVVVNAYIKKNVRMVVEGEEETNDMLFMDIEVLNTREGKDLRALFEAGCSIGTSIRGVGDMEGRYVRNYELFGVDMVGNPSSSTFSRMPVSESVSVELQNNLKETFTVSTSSTNVVRDLDAAADIQSQLDSIGYGTVTKTSTKVDEETDPKTGAQTSITTLEAETSDDVADLDQALMMAKNAMLNGVVSVDSITIENVKEEQPKESVSEDKPETQYIPENEMKTKAMTEAKKEDAEDPNTGKKFVLKTDRGFVNFDKNAIDFTQNPDDALHFTHGKEESGMVSMSKVTEILDAMGIFDVEKYYQTGIVNLGDTGTTDSTDAEPKEEGLMTGDINLSVGDVGVGGIGSIGKDEAAITEENGSNTKYIARVETLNANGTPDIETIPVSAVDTDKALAEISNLWEMKSKSSGEQTKVILVDTTTNSEFYYNPNTNSFDTMQEAAPELQQKDNEISMEFDDQEIKKDFESPVQASIAKAGIEAGKLDPKVLMTDETVDEKLYKNPSAASDEYVDVALKDAVFDTLIVTLRDIDYDFETILNDPEIPDNTDMEELIKMLPDPWTIRLNSVDIPDNGSVEDLKQAILKAANEQAPWAVLNAVIQDVQEENGLRLHSDDWKDEPIEPDYFDTHDENGNEISTK